MEPQNNPYDFILKPPEKKKGLSFNWATGKQKILFIIAIAGIALVVLGSLILMLQGNSNKDAEQLYKLSASQLDIIDLISTNSSNLRNQKLTGQSATVLMIVSSQNNEISNYMAKNGLSKSSKQIKEYRNNQYKQVLEDAQATGKFEESYTAILTNRLDEYRNLLRNIYGTTKSKTLKNITVNSYDQIAIVMAS